ncbi:hypothetical protein H5A18_11650 [Pectobacterium brasiliense]|uniref:hypothetical protein n=1 Tax=Pectobacterium brasiliense TaxID=180957 RepID=UPI000CE6981F|nr:hypothetical protein [Pectobacterium brasiliense]MBN3182556.1 hypothetical protein [Pectobacterium brasiliense]PPE64789.1 hypothetical protein F152LOC_00254 [Pectobacterium brasiliense]
MNKYISDLLIFIESIDINKNLLSHEICEVNGDKSTIKSTIYVNTSQPKKYSFSINQTAMFMLLDAFVDYSHPKMMNKGFKDKYKRLPENSTCDRVIKGTFRISRILRNALIHNVNSLQESSETINIVSKESLKIKTRAINTLNFIVWYSTKNDLSLYYNELVLVSAYNNLVDDIVEINDDIGKEVLSLSFDTKLKTFKRYEVTGVKVEKDGDKIIIQRKEFVYDIPDIKTGVLQKGVVTGSSDYVINIDGKVYFIPDECLAINEDNNAGYLLLNDLCKFEKKNLLANTSNIHTNY